jgi:hypothetical protein
MPSEMIGGRHMTNKQTNKQTNKHELHVVDRFVLVGWHFCCCWLVGWLVGFNESHDPHITLAYSLSLLSSSSLTFVETQDGKNSLMPADDCKQMSKQANKQQMYGVVCFVYLLLD